MGFQKCVRDLIGRRQLLRRLGGYCWCILHRRGNPLECLSVLLCFVVVIFALCCGWGRRSVWSIRCLAKFEERLAVLNDFFVFSEPCGEAPVSLSHIRLSAVRARQLINS